MLQTEPLSQLLEEKWEKFAGRMILFNLLFYFLYLIIFTAVAYNKKDGEVNRLTQTVTDLFGHLTPVLMSPLCSTATVSP